MVPVDPDSLMNTGVPGCKTFSGTTLCRWLRLSLCFSLLSASLSRSLSMSGQHGLRFAWKVGMVFLSFRPISSSDPE